MNASMPVPFLDLVTPHLELEEELTTVFRNALLSASFIGGPAVENFERDFAAFCDTKYAIAVGSGTDALRFALLAAGIRGGEVVVTVPNTFIATTEAISQAGAIPAFVDIDEATYNMSPEKLQVFLGEQCTRNHAGQLISKLHNKPVVAILPVHLYGQMADMDALVELADRYGLMVLEDACQAHGAQYYSRLANRWITAGSAGAAAGFSFYPGKNLGACGEAGAVTTNDLSIAEKIRMLRDHGQSQKYYHKIEGYNGRLDAIQAGLLHVKLRHLAKWTEQRRQHALEYNRLLADVDGIICPSEPSASRAVYHLYVIRTEDRDGLINHMKSAGIGMGIHYPVPLHLQEAYGALGYKAGDFPVAERAASHIVSLPMFPQLTAEQQARVAEEVCAFVAHARRAAPEPNLQLAGPVVQNA
jgi:dTDP-4-amino-4,6-dideoxygalactose transaminase